MIREPYVAGYFYPSSADELRATIAQYSDENTPKQDVVGLLAPHAGYMYSGPVTGATVSRINVRDTAVIIGPSHSGLGKPYSVWAEGSWLTPLGEAPVNSALARRMIEVSEYLSEDYGAHREEHAVEVQVPFLQYFKPDVRIVPVILAGSSADDYRRIGRDIARAVKDTKEDAIIMASGDMTHYETYEAAEKKDMQAIEAMLALDEPELTRRYHDLHISMCAYGPLVCLLSAAVELGSSGAELVKYQTSGDVTGDRDAVVGYAGVIFKGG